MKSLNRSRNPTDELKEAIFEGSNITALLLRPPQSLLQSERDLLKTYYSLKGKEHLLEIAEGKKILPFVADVFIYLGCDRRFWQPHYDFFLRRNSLVLGLIDEVFGALESAGCKSVVLTENFGVLLASESSLACFCSGDVDLSADIAEMQIIVDCLNAFGFQSKDQPSRIGEYSGQSLQFFSESVIAGGFWINVIWKPVTRAFLVQDKYEDRLRQARLSAKRYRGTNIRILEDTSLLYFCALHSSAGHYYTLSPGLRLFVDIDRMGRKPTIDWRSIERWESEDQAGIRISMALYLAKKALKTPVPEPLFSKIFASRRSRQLASYLIDSETNQIQTKSSLLRRLYIELVSDDRNIVINFFVRVFRFMDSR